MRLCAWLLAVALCWQGCAVRRGPPPPVYAPGPDGARSFLAALGERGCPSTLAADLEIAIRAARAADGAHLDPKGTLYGGLRAAWPDRIRVQARAGPFVPVLSAAANGDSVFLSLPRQRAFWSGSLSGTGDGVTLSAGATVTTLLALLCPGAAVSRLDDPTLETADGGYVLRGRPEATQEATWVEARFRSKDLRIQELRVSSGSGGGLLHAVYGSMSRVEGKDVPRRIRVRWLRPGAPLLEVDMKITGAEPDGPAGPEVFRIPPPRGAVPLSDEEILELLRRSVPG